MLYIYDILVNFMDGDRVYEFFEWDNKDLIEHIKKIPVIRIDNKTFNDLINNDVEVDNSFLSLIKDKTCTYKEIIKYACIFSNNDKCYAFEFNSTGDILFRSSLLIDEEEDIVLCSRKLPEFKLTYKIIENNKDASFKFTRAEERDKNFLKRDIISTYNDKKFDKLNYLYEEAYGDDNYNIEKRYNRLIDDIDNIFSSNIRKLVRIIKLTYKKKKTF